jgi:hypothetical protein
MKNLQEFPLARYAENPLAANELAVAHNLTRYQAWLPAQLLQLFSTWPIVTVEGRASMVATVHEACTDARNRGAWTLANLVKRSLLIKNQVKPEGAEYGTIVPLVLAAFKKYHNIPYETWRGEDLTTVVEKNLWQAMQCRVPQLTTDEILRIRDLGLLTRSGPRMGQAKSVTGTWRLTGIADTELGQLPTLAQAMCTQIWLCHPTVRNHYMILDPHNWDLVPEPLQTIEIFDPKPQPQPLPWSS